ncbi:MAG: hypothetical protein NC123_09810 [Butyrivibrio sp.]|nr:hypothetical protein [Butyrivibrio sp.]
MELPAILIMTIVKLYLLIGACRVLSMTFKTFSRSITIKNRKAANVLIAYKNTWGIATSANKRNKMHLSGVFAYMMGLPEIIFLICEWFTFIKTGVARQSPEETSYIVLLATYYVVGMLRNINVANKFSKGAIW